MSGSSPAAAGGSTANADARAPAGRIVIGEESSLIKILDPGQGNDSVTLHFMWPVFDALTWIDNGTVKPGLATSWQSDDGKAWQFTLGDYKFQNGRPVTSQDVVDTYNRYRDPANKSPNATIFATVASVRAIDPKNVQIITKVINPTLPNLLTLAMILPMQELNAQGDAAFFQKPFGSGAFKADSVDFSTGLRYTTMGKDWVTPMGVPRLQEINIRIIPDEGARQAALRSGDVDVVTRLTPDTTNALHKQGFQTIAADALGSAHFLLDPVHPPLSDVRVRQALNYAFDKQTLIDTLLRGFATPDGQLIGKSCLGYNPNVQAYPYDLQKARQLLADAGFPKGLAVAMTVPRLASLGPDIGQAVAAQLGEAGITIDLTTEETAVWFGQFYGPQDGRKGIWGEIISWDQTYEPDSTWRWFTSDLPDSGGRRWDDQTFDDMYQQARTTLDRTQRTRSYQQAGQYLHDQAPVLFGWVGQLLASAKTGVTFTPIYKADMYAAMTGPSG